MVWKFVIWVLLSLLATSKSAVPENDNDQQLFEKDKVSMDDQSPVNIIEGDTKVVNLTPLKYGNLNTFDKTEMLLRNTGATVRVKFPDNTLNLPEITGGPLLNKIYKFEQMHLHWGKENQGSEHEINGVRFAMEVHLVYYDSEYESLVKAMDDPKGLCVFSIIGKISEENNPSLVLFIDDLDKVIEPNSEIKINFNEKFSWIKESFIQDYYTYHGSLTTEPYKGCVTWVISNKTFEVSSEQLKKFRELQKEKIDSKVNDGEKCINTNIRKLQKLLNRTVYHVKGAVNNE